MKAVIFRQHGGPEVLEYADVAEPRMKANEVLVEVRACALNHLDVWARGGLPGIVIPLPHILGNDVAGGMSLSEAIARQPLFPKGLSSVLAWSEVQQGLPDALRMAGRQERAPLPAGDHVEAERGRPVGQRSATRPEDT